MNYFIGHNRLETRKTSRWSLPVSQAISKHKVIILMFEELEIIKQKKPRSPPYSFEGIGNFVRMI